MLGEVGQAQRLGVGDQQAEDAVTLGQVADRTARVVVDADGDELGEARARLVEHAERAVGGVDEVDGAADDAPQHRRQVEVGADRQHGVEQLTPAAVRRRAHSAASVGRTVRRSPTGGRPQAGCLLTTTAVTIPNMPSGDSTWLRMWQCHTQVPGASALKITV